MEKQNTPIEETKKPDDDVLGTAIDHIKIIDVKSNKEILNRRG